MVGVILMAGTALSLALGDAASLRHGMFGSDNLSPNGALLAVKGAPILLDIAHQMERLCPDAWLTIFANPVAVLSGLVNRYTKIKALGVCQGFTNHQWDLARLLGRDEQDEDFRVTAAGVNHLSFIIDGTFRGKELFSQLDRALVADWKPTTFGAGYPSNVVADMTKGLEKLVQIYRELGVMIFSTEKDGMMHLYYDEEVARLAEHIPTVNEVHELVAEQGRERRKANEEFSAYANADLDDNFWNCQEQTSALANCKDDVFIRIMRGVSKMAPVEIVTSRLNEGAIEGIGNDVVVEYSQCLFGNSIRSAGRFKIPGVVHGLVSSLANHQTMLAEACFADDPKMLALALLAYPIHPFSSQSKALYRELIAINRSEISASLGRTDEFLR